MNSGQNDFFDASSITGFDLPDDGRGIAQVDWDHDGDLDFWISNRTGPQIRFLENALKQTGNFVAVRLVGSKSNRDAIGSVVRVFTDENAKPVCRSLAAGNSFSSQSSKLLHFGLGKADSINRIQVVWPDGSEKHVQGRICKL